MGEKSKLPPGAKPLLLSLYADKSKLSSFGTKKGYPVIARCANLPVEIRNGKGLGGGRVVGWLPVVCSYVFMVPHSIPCLTAHSRLRGIKPSLEKQNMLTSSVLFGMTHSTSCLHRSMTLLRLDIPLNVVMELSVTSTQPSLYFQQIMKNSKAKYISCNSI